MLFCRQGGSFAKKNEAMLYRKSERFLAHLAACSEEELRSIDYCLICKQLRTAPADLDEILEEELGMTGEELLRLPSNFYKFADYLKEIQLKTTIK